MTFYDLLEAAIVGLVIADVICLVMWKLFGGKEGRLAMAQADIHGGVYGFLYSRDDCLFTGLDKGVGIMKRLIVVAVLLFMWVGCGQERKREEPPKPTEITMERFVLQGQYSHWMGSNLLTYDIHFSSNDPFIESLVKSKEANTDKFSYYVIYRTTKEIDYHQKKEITVTKILIECSAKIIPCSENPDDVKKQAAEHFLSTVKEYNNLYNKLKILGVVKEVK